MNALLSYMKSYIVLFLVIMILVQMIPQNHLHKYIHFFARMILVFGLLCPVMDRIGKSDVFLEQIQYETFLQQLEEISTDAEKITYIDNGYYVEKYEDAIEFDIVQMAQNFDFAVKDITVTMTEQYEIKKIRMELGNPSEEGIVIGKVTLQDEKEKQAQPDEAAYKKLKEQLIGYYQIPEEQLEIFYSS